MTALVDRPPAIEELVPRQHLVFRKAQVSEAERMILLMVWQQYRENGGVTWRTLSFLTGYSAGKLQHWLTVRDMNLQERGLVKLASDESPDDRKRIHGGVRPGPRLAMRKAEPWELVDVP